MPHSPGDIAPVAVLRPTSFRLERKDGAAGAAALQNAEVVEVPAGGIRTLGTIPEIAVKEPESGISARLRTTCFRTECKNGSGISAARCRTTPPQRHQCSACRTTPPPPEVVEVPGGGFDSLLQSLSTRIKCKSGVQSKA